MKSTFTAALASAFFCLLGIAAAPTPQPAPEIFLSLRGVANQTVEVGEPLFLAVRIEADPDRGAAIQLSPASGTWADAVEVEIAAGSGASLKVRARPVAPPEKPSVMVGAEQPTSGVWFVASAAAAQLAPGEYIARARLAISGGKGWNGEAISEETTLRVVAPSEAPERVRQRAMARAHEAVVSNAPDEAARWLDQQLTLNPDDISLLTLRAALCLRGGDYRSAAVCVNRAIDRFEKSGRTHPPGDLLALESEISLARLSPATMAIVPPAWTRLPASLMTAGQEKPGSTAVAPVAATGPIAVTSPAPRPGATAVSASIPTAPSAPPPPASISLPVPSAKAAPSGSASIGVIVPAAELTDAIVAAAADGQWAASATASSVYGKTQYSAAQATGGPNIKVAGNSPDAWCPAKKNEGTEWLEVTFAKPVHATDVRIRQNDTVGAIAKIEAIDANGTAHVWWEGVDSYVLPTTREIAWFSVRVPKTSYLVAKVKITLNLAVVPGWKQIDAVQLVGQP